MQYNELMQNIYQAKGQTLLEQYLDLGRLFASHIAESASKLAKKRSKKSIIRREVAGRTWDHLRTNRIAREFCDCLAAWADGAGISPTQAMWLLADNLSGCQTMIARFANGVALLHTEEEFIDQAHIELHMSNPIVVELHEKNARYLTLVYNNLLPGCGLYAWKADMIVAVDSLFLKEDKLLEVERPLLANIVSWMIWRMEPSDASPSNILQIIEDMGELVDGYAINVVRKVGTEIEGYKITLARSESRVEALGKTVGSTLRQNNLIDPKYPRMKWETAPRNIWRGGNKFYINRYKTMDKHIKMYKQYVKWQVKMPDLTQIHKSIQKTILLTLKDAYVNPDMGALCVGLIFDNVTSVSVKKNNTKYDTLEVMEKTS